MCGIVGQARADGAAVDPLLVGRMCVALEHRGPDSRGMHVADGVGLGIQRLRVIDLQTGDQPIYNEDRSIIVVLNGEIYNFDVLRARLEAAGHVFSTRADTEVIAHLYEQEGSRCVRSLRGMFAFALWDSRRRRLLLARDHVGKKPLFYALRDGVLTFASELRAILQDDSLGRDLDPTALDCYLAYGYVPAPRSIFKAVRKLAPASTLVYEAGKATVERYWRLDYSHKCDVDGLHDRLRDEIRRAVRRRMVADVPLGAFLSGGIDSSLVVGMMAEAASQPVKTFSIGFDSDKFNELRQARQIAERFGTEHHEFVVTPSAVDLAPKLVRHYGEPFADASAIPSFVLAELTRRHVTVALNGDGGDESFAGYSRYAANLVAQRIARLPSPARRSATALSKGLLASGYAPVTANRVRRLTSTLSMSDPERYATYMAYFDQGGRDALYSDQLKAELGNTDALAVIQGPWADGALGSLDVLLAVDVETYLPGDLLVKMDIASMASSLEARSPLLDISVMELAASIPAALKARRLQKKVILRDALRGWLPDQILDAPKRGFGVPMADWLRGELAGWSREILLDPRTRTRGYFDQHRVEHLLDRHLEGSSDESLRLWALVMLELWHREFVDEFERVSEADVA